MEAMQRVVDIYLDSLKSSTRRTMETRLRSVTSFLNVAYEDFDWREMNAALLEHVRNGLLEAGVAPGTVNVALAAVRGVVRVARNQGFVSYEQYARLQAVRGLPRDPEPVGRAATGRELDALFAVCARDGSAGGVRDLAIIAALYAGGMHASELVMLELKDWSPEPASLSVSSGRAYQLRTILLGPRAADAVAGWVAIRGQRPGRLFLPINKGGGISGDGMTAHAIYGVATTRSKAASLHPPLTPHDIRRTAIRDLTQAGAGPLTVKRIVGAASLWTLERYREGGLRRDLRAKRRGQTLYHKWEEVEIRPDVDVFALLRR